MISSVADITANVNLTVIPKLLQVAVTACHGEADTPDTLKDK